MLAERRRLAEHYTELLSDVAEIALPGAPEKCGHTYQSYVIRVRQGGMAKRNQIMEELDTLQIQTRPGTHAVHRLGYYAHKYESKPGKIRPPVAAACEDTTITLPLFPGMTEAQQQFIAASLKKALGSA